MRRHAHRCGWLVVVLLAMFSVALNSVHAADRPPNIILITIDDLGYADVGAYGNTVHRTPHLDKFAADGMRFTSFYATPVCSMSRAQLMTGCYNVRVSIPGVLFPQSKEGLNPAETTVARMLKARGYATAAVGKWHLGHLPPSLPTNHGFDRYFGIPYSNDMGVGNGRRNHPPLPLMRDEKVIETEPDQALLTKRYTEEAIAFIREKKDSPFFLYLPHTMVHVPLFASADFKDKSRNGLYGDCVEEIDWSVGRIMAVLDELKLADQTLIMFLSDNGGTSRGSNAPLRGHKASTWEGGVRVPCIVRWPGKIPAGTVTDVVAGNIDVLPTFAALTGAELPKNKIDGADISKVLLSNARDAVHEHYLIFSGITIKGIRSGNWKLHLSSGDRGAPAKAKNRQAEVALYDLSVDLGETKNVADEHPQIVAQLKAEAEKQFAEINANRRPAATLKQP